MSHPALKKLAIPLRVCACAIPLHASERLHDGIDVVAKQVAQRHRDAIIFESTVPQRSQCVVEFTERGRKLARAHANEIVDDGRDHTAHENDVHIFLQKGSLHREWKLFKQPGRLAPYGIMHAHIIIIILHVPQTVDVPPMHELIRPNSVHEAMVNLQEGAARARVDPWHGARVFAPFCERRQYILVGPDGMFCAHHVLCDNFEMFGLSRRRMQQSILAFAIKAKSATTTHLDGTLLVRDLDETEREKHVRALTFKPKVRGPVTTGVADVCAFVQDDGGLRVPRFYDAFGAPDEDSSSDGAAIDVPFEESLFDDQVVAQQRTLQALRTRGGCIMVRRAGGGKTALALNIASVLGRRTLVLVHKSFFLEQWTERVKKFLPSATVGVIRQSKFEVEADIVIGMIQTIMRRDYGDVLRTFGTLIIDECHHMPAPFFLSCFFKRGLAPRYILGLTATPDRADGLSPILKLGMGELVDTNSGTAAGSAREKVSVTMINYTGGSRREVMSRSGQLMMPMMINDLVDDTHRTWLIVQRVALLRAEGHQVIVLSDRLKQLDLICAGLVGDAGVAQTEVAYYVGSTPARERGVAAQRGILLATYSMAKEGVWSTTTSHTFPFSLLVLPSLRLGHSDALGVRLRHTHRQRRAGGGAHSASLCDEAHAGRMYRLCRHLFHILAHGAQATAAVRLARV